MLQRGGNSLDPNVLVLTIVTCKASGQNNGRGVCSKPEGAAVQPQGLASTHVNRSLNSYTDRRLHFRVRMAGVVTEHSLFTFADLRLSLL